MRRPIQLLTALLFVALVAAPAGATAWDRGRAARFATLPEGTAAPEGLEIAPDGEVYVSIFGSTSGAGELLAFDRHGRFERRVPVPDASASLLGLAFRPGSDTLLVVDFGGAQVLAVDPDTGASTPFLTLPALPRPELGAGLNDVTFDRAGNVYVSDSFQGVVWRTGPGGGEATAWVDDPLLRTTGVPPFGANGLRFDGAGTALFVANTGSDWLVRVPVSGGVAGVPAVFATGINGADGLEVDEDDNVWVTANQTDEIVVVDPTGRAIEKLGDFDGLARDGGARGFLFPASLRLREKDVLVTNLALDLRQVNPAFTSVDSAWCAEVTLHTIASIRRPR
jgi:sugar lactone lactonase YvrE